MTQAATAIVLAGGHSTRLGREKSREQIFGETLIERVIGKVRPLGAEVLLVISKRQAQAGDFRFPGVKTVTDLFPDRGSLGGIYTGLKLSSNSTNVVVGCDMPFLNFGLLSYMVSLAPGFDVVIPRVGHLIEPLHAVYSRNCVAPIERQLNEGNLKVADFLRTLNVRYVEPAELDRFDPEHISFFNINTEADLEKAKGLAALENKEARLQTMDCQK